MSTLFLKNFMFFLVSFLYYKKVAFFALKAHFTRHKHWNGVIVDEPFNAFFSVHFLAERLISLFIQLAAGNFFFAVRNGRVQQLVELRDLPR